MGDIEDKIKERWTQRRKKGYNWQKLIIMVLALVAIFYAMGRLQNAGNIVVKPSASVVDSTAASAGLTP